MLCCSKRGYKAPSLVWLTTPISEEPPLSTDAKTDELMNERSSLSSSLAETTCPHGLGKGEIQNEGRRSGHLH